MIILLCGASGKMGTEVRTLAMELGHSVVPLLRGSFVGHSADVIVDFSGSDGTILSAQAAMDLRIPLVSGTTNLTAEALHALQDAAIAVPVVHSNNFAIGIQVLMESVREWATKLPGEFSVDIVEMHHRRKTAISGTALELAAIVDGEGKGRRRPTTCHSIRGGDVNSSHEIRFLGDGEMFCVHHIATGRQVFARGALRVAERLHSCREQLAPRFYSPLELMG
jgi:4-hydroxy-tetrahydrodipicolinate reductase